MIIPKSFFTADGVDHDQDPPTFDSCDLHWPPVRDAALHNGHDVVDATGDLRELARDFPGWNVFRSDGGRLYASVPVNGTGHGMTLDGWLVGPLRAQMSAALTRTAGTPRDRG